MRVQCGLTLAEVAGDDLDESTGHAETQIAALLDKASDQAAGVVLAFLALEGLLGCAEWFGSWRWPPRVDAFVAILHDPDHAWWQRIPSRRYPASEVASLDIDQLRSRLLAGPEDWDTGLLGFCLRHGIDYVPLPTPADAATP